MKRLKQYSFWEYMRVLLVFIAGLAVSLLVFSYNVQVRTEQNVEELLDYNTDHQQSQLKFMLNTQFIYLGNIADYVAKEDSLMCEKNQGKSGRNRERLETARQDFKFHRKNCIKVKYKKQAYYIAYESLGYNQWMLCYMVPVSVASEEYSFITVYEYRLLGAVIVGVLIMLLVLWKLNQKKQTDLDKSCTDGLDDQYTEQKQYPVSDQ